MDFFSHNRTEDFLTDGTSDTLVHEQPIYKYCSQYFSLLPHFFTTEHINANAINNSEAATKKVMHIGPVNYLEEKRKQLHCINVLHEVAKIKLQKTQKYLADVRKNTLFLLHILSCMLVYAVKFSNAKSVDKDVFEKEIFTVQNLRNSLSNSEDPYQCNQILQEHIPIIRKLLHRHFHLYLDFRETSHLKISSFMKRIGVDATFPNGDFLTKQLLTSLKRITHGDLYIPSLAENMKSEKEDIDHHDISDFSKNSAGISFLAQESEVGFDKYRSKHVV